MDFQARKLASLRTLASPFPDKSLKGSVDLPISDLISRINSHPSFFTTSSCSGRISISTSPYSHLQDDSSIPNPPAKKKKGGHWNFVTHDQADAEQVLHAVLQSCGDGGEAVHQQHDGQSSMTVFRFEPFILAVECLNLAAAQALVSCAISSGFRESGITSITKRIIAAVRCSIRIEAPIALGGRLIVSQDYIRSLVSIANLKMTKNRKRTDNFLSCFIQQVEFTLCDEGSKLVQLNVHREDEEGCISKERRLLSKRYKDKASSSEINERKFGELENRQLKIISKLDDVEKRINDLLSMKSSYTDPFPRLNTGLTCNISDKKSEEILFQPVLESHLEGRYKGIIFKTLSVASDLLHRWGHTTCFLNGIPSFPSVSVLIFGGYGGTIKQGRQNDLILLNLNDSTVLSIHPENPPAPRMGHTASLVGLTMVVIGGRESPSRPFGEVCVLLLDRMLWQYPEVGGAYFSPRHRHTAVTIEGKIYVFGGLDNEKVLGDLVILNTISMQWSVTKSAGNSPAPRHSHSMTVANKRIYLFGGFNGTTVLGDLWDLDPVNTIWTYVETSTVPRFSHSMSVSFPYLMLLGGCPLAKNTNVVSILDMEKRDWVHVKSDMPSESLFVRHTATSIGHKIVVIGGGVSCYAFGIKFSPPVIIDLISLMENMEDKICQRRSENGHIHHLQDDSVKQSYSWALKVKKIHAKIIKDNLKHLGWLDVKRKAKIEEDNKLVLFPITADAAYELQKSDKRCQTFRGVLSAHAGNAVEYEIIQQKVQQNPTPLKNPHDILFNAVQLFLERNKIPTILMQELPKRWERLDNMAVLPAGAFKSEIWSRLGQEFWPIVAKALNVQRIARQARVTANGTRDSQLSLLFGSNGWVQHRENGILYCFDATRCMFSSGNVSEKLRMANLDCTGETVIDLFAGIGYFVLPFLLKAKAKRVYACEWNHPAVDALRYNLRVNGVEDRCIVLEGDNRFTAPHGIANRVCLGLLPTSEHCWEVAVKALRPDGGILHVHGNVKDIEEQQWVEHVCYTIRTLACNEGHQWDVRPTHIERVKWYAPHIRHLVVDVTCRSEIMEG